MSGRREPSAEPTSAESMALSRLQRVVFVDDEEDILFVAKAMFGNHLPSIQLEVFSDPNTALAALRDEAPDLLITDLRMPGISGIELIFWAREARPSLPVVVVSAFGTAELREEIARKSSMAFMEKPFTVEALRAAIVRAASESRPAPHELKGEVVLSGMVDLLQLYALSGATGRLDLAHASGDSSFWFERGGIVHAECGGLVGETAVHSTLGWVGGKFTFHVGDPPPRTTIETSWQQVLLEGCALLDEAERLEKAPALEEPAGSKDRMTNAASSPQEKGRLEMATVKETLQNLGSIDGFIGACVVDANSGMMLGSEGGGNVNLELAAAGNTEVIRAKRKTMAALGLDDVIEDILISLGKQYHLLRPLAKKDGLFVYAVLDKTKANLAMARLQLAEAEKSLTV